MTTRTCDVFVSYKAEDRARLQPLVAGLEAEGFSVWWDAQIGGGVNWREEIQKHLDAAECVIVAWSKRSVGREGNFVRDEASRAQRRGAYLPICLDAVEPPLGFGEVQAILLTGWKGNRSDPRYRAAVEAVRNRVADKGMRAPPRQEKWVASRRVVIAGGVSTGIIAVTAAGRWFLSGSSDRSSKRIAVLPFANLSSDKEQTYFAEGVAEELRAALSRAGLEVIGRESSNAVKDLDTKAAAAKLEVGNILTGSVRRSPQTIRITAQLLSGSDGVQRWAQTYDRAPGDAIKIQSAIAADVAEALSIALGVAGRAALTLGGTADSVAQDLYLQAVEIRRKDASEASARKALSLIEAALARDPNYAEAYGQRAILFLVLASYYSKGPAEVSNNLAQADAAAQRAIMLAPKLGFPRAVLSSIEQHRFEFSSSLRHMRMAIALSPDEPRLVRLAAVTIPLLGAVQEALRLADRLAVLDPIDSRTFSVRSEIFLIARMYPEAIEAGRKALALTPERLGPHGLIGDALTLLNRPAEARLEYRHLPPKDVTFFTAEAILAARSGSLREAEQSVALMRQIFGAGAYYQYARIYAQAGNFDRAFAELNDALEVRDPDLINLRVDPFLEPIRRDPRYEHLVTTLNFP